MNRTQMAKRLARQSHISPAQAADQIDRLVHDIVSRLRKGEAAAVPGLGNFKPGGKWTFQFERKESDGE